MQFKHQETHHEHVHYVANYWVSTFSIGIAEMCSE